MRRSAAGPVAAGVVAAAWGVVAGLWTPRGPATTGQALASIGISLAVGLLAGWLSRSRWAMLLAPLLFVVALEAVRARLRGPTVDGPHLSAFGIGALVLGRGVHGLLSVLPMLVGAAYGAGIARRTAAGTRDGRFRRYAGRAAVGLLAAGLALVTVGVALPARTDPIPGAGSIAELTTVTVRGHRFGLMLRGADAAAPVLLVVPGPPGGSEVGAVRRHLAALEQHFVVATWDRRGGPRSFAALDPTSTLTLDDEVENIVAVADHLRERFGRDRIYLFAASGGAILGVFAVQRRPELFRAYVGAGLVASLRDSDRLQYEDTLAWARRTGDTGLEKRLTDLGPPPYADIYAYEPLLTTEGRAFAYDRSRNAEGADGAAESLGVPEYTLLEKAHFLGAVLDGFDLLYPRMQDVDLRTQVTRLEVPVYLVVGAHEVPGRVTILREWYGLLQAPHKEIVVLDTSGHRPQFEQPGPFVDVMRRVLAETS